MNELNYYIRKQDISQKIWSEKVNYKIIHIIIYIYNIYNDYTIKHVNNEGIYCL